MKSEFDLALTQVCNERGLSKEVVLEAIEIAMVSAYKRDFESGQDISINLDPKSGQWRVYAHKEIVEEALDELQQMTIEEAQKLKPEVQIGDKLTFELTPRNFGRIAAQTAKQVILQRIREAERDTLYDEYSGREGEVINGTVQNVDPRSRAVTIYLGKIGALLPPSEQIRTERYRFNQRLRVYVLQVEKTSRGPQVIVSRAHKGLLRRLLELEVPEVFNGTVEIKAIAREAGSRSKVAVVATKPGVDPVGSCVGMRGVRIQHIVNELNGEKIDVVAWSPDEATFIASALSPATATEVMLREETRTAVVAVPDRQLSLAIGKEGQNARLAAKLTGWRIDIKSETEAAAAAEQRAAEEAVAAALAEEKAAAQAAAKALLAEAEAALAEEEAQEALVKGATAQPIAEDVAAETIVEPVEGDVVEEPAVETEAEKVLEGPVPEVLAEEAPEAEETGVSEIAVSVAEDVVVELSDGQEDQGEVLLVEDAAHAIEEMPVEIPSATETGVAEKRPVLVPGVRPKEWYSEEDLEKEKQEGLRGKKGGKKVRKGDEPQVRDQKRSRTGRRDWRDYLDGDEEY
ncbi:MAG: transcription termination factor NusA [Anaerolineae bacterium]|nr:transcription termination factor NusA [Anaerolineae bacterium]